MVYAIISDGSELSPAWNDPNHSSLAVLKKRLKEQLRELCSKDDSKFYVNCEYGVPLWAAEIICELKKSHSAQLNIVVPYEEQAAEWSSSRRTRYYNIHEQADEVHMAIKQYREGCYDEADEFMVLSCDVLIVYASEPSDLYAVRFAKEHGKDIIFF